MLQNQWTQLHYYLLLLWSVVPALHFTISLMFVEILLLLALFAVVLRNLSPVVESLLKAFLAEQFLWDMTMNNQNAPHFIHSGETFLNLKLDLRHLWQLTSVFSSPSFPSSLSPRNSSMYSVVISVISSISTLVVASSKVLELKMLCNSRVEWLGRHYVREKDSFISNKHFQCSDLNIF